MISTVFVYSYFIVYVIIVDKISLMSKNRLFRCKSYYNNFLILETQKICSTEYSM